GVVSSRLNEGENIGYVIPNEEIDSFLKDIRDGRYHGKLEEASGTNFQSLENDSLRRCLKLDKKVTGVAMLPPKQPAANYPFREFDVVTNIGDYAIDNDGLVQMPDDLPLSFYSFLPQLARRGAVPVTLIRQGQTISTFLPVTRVDNRLIPSFHGDKPRY